MIIKKIKLIKPCKENNFAKVDKSIKRIRCVYLLFDKDLKLIYVGRTKNFRLRLLQHISPESNSRYHPDYGERQKYTSKLPKGIVKYYAITKTKGELDERIIELLLTKFLEPIPNEELWK